MGAVQGDEAHAAEHPLVHPPDDLVLDVAMRLVAPPDEHVGCVQAAAVEAVLKHEQYISRRINDLVDLANNENDHATTVVLHWYVNEQVEEEATADTLFHQVQMVEGSPHGLLMIDRELAGRPAAAPVDTAEA